MPSRVRALVVMMTAAEAKAQADGRCAVVIVRGVRRIAVIIRTVWVRTGIVAVVVRPVIAVAAVVRPVIAVTAVSIRRIGGAAGQDYNGCDGGRSFRQRSHRGLFLATPQRRGDYFISNDSPRERHRPAPDLRVGGTPKVVRVLLLAIVRCQECGAQGPGGNVDPERAV